MNKKILKLVSMLLVVLIICSFGMNIVYASNPIDGISIDTGFKGSSEINTAAGKILGVIQVIGTAIAIGMLLYLGIKYIMSSPDDRASIKKSATMYVIGAIVLFAAVNIVKIIYEFATSAITA